MKIESIKLTEERRAALVKVARQVGAKNTRGTHVGAPSWRALLYAIADGELVVTKPKRGK